MCMIRVARRWIAAVAIAAFLSATLPFGAVQAGMVTTESVIGHLTDQPDRDRLYRFLERDDVRQQMQALGVDPDEARARAGHLTDAEVARINGQLEQLPAGENFLGALVGLAVLFVIVLVITDLLGYSDVFKGLGPGKRESGT